MRFMIIRRADADTEAGVMPTEEIVSAMMDYHEEMGRHLKILAGNGLHPSSKGARVKFTNGKPLVTDGPFTETKEIIAGFSMVEAESMEQVLEWAQRWPAICGEANVELEVRQVYENEELGVGFTPELQDKAKRIGLTA
jgi:hypothetical protein